MSISVKKVLLAGTAIVAAAMFAPGSARAEDCTGTVPGADCTIDQNVLQGAPLTLGAGDVLTFSSSVNLNVNDTIDSDTADAQGDIATAGNGTSVFQNATIGGTWQIDTLTVGSGDIWYLSASTLNLASSGGLTLSGGEFIFYGSASTVNTNGGGVTGGAASDEITFDSAGGHLLNVGALSMGGGADEIDFDASSAGLNDAISFASVIATSFDMGDGNDTITFSSGGVIDVSSGTSTLNLGAGDDTIEFISSGMIVADTVNGGSGTDTVSFESADFGVTSLFTGIENINMTTANTLTFSSGGSVTNGAISLGAAGADLIFNSAGGTISGTITGGAGAQSVTLIDGTISSTASLGAGDDVVYYSGGSLTGTVNFGADNDMLVIGGDVEVGAAMSGLETITVGANTLTISAAITGVNDADNTGLDATGSTLLINSGGSVDGAIHGNGAGSVTFGADGNGGTFNLGGIVEDVQLFLSSGTLSTNGFALGGNSPLAKVYVSAGTFNVSDNVTTARFVNSGTTVIDYDAVIDAGATDITGGGTYQFMYYNSAGTETIGGVTTTGSIDFTSASLVFAVASGSGVVTTGTDVIQFASATGTADATGATVSDTSFLYDFAINDTGAILGLDITQSVSLAEASSTANNLAVATVLLTDPDLTGTTDPELQALQAAVSGASTQEAFNDALEQAQPTVDGSSMVVAMNVVNSSFSMVGDRLAALRTGEDVTGMTTGNISEGVRVWGQGFAATGQQDDRDGIDGYDFDTYGFAAGMDTDNMAEDTVVGIAFSYANTDSDSDNGSRTNTNTDSYQFTIYGDHDFDSRTYLNGMAAYTFNDVETDRLVAGSTAKGDFDANQYTFRAETGRDYAFETATLTPNLMAHWTHYDPDGYTETGAGGAGLVVDQDSVDIVELGIGVDASWLFQNADGSYFSPVVNVGYRYDFVGDDVGMTSRFIGGGQAFTTNGFDAQQSTVDAGAGFSYYTTENWELTAEYDYEWKEDFDAHSGMFRAAYRF